MPNGKQNDNLGTSAPPAQAAEASSWTQRLLPLMVVMTVGLTLFFLVVSMLQMQSLNDAIRDAPRMDLAPVFEGFAQTPTTEETVRLRAYLSLEANLIERRHHASNVALMARLWTRYMGFITGMTLAMVGAAFVLGRLTGGGTLSGDVGSAKVHLQTASPGLFMIALGAMLMVITITNHPRINVVDKAIYLSRMSGAPAGGQADDATAGTTEESGNGLPAVPEWGPPKEEASE